VRTYNGKVAVITGAGSGIGRALAVELAGLGAKVAVSDIDAAAAGVTAQLCRDLGAESQAAALDVADRDAFFSYASDVVGEFGAVDLVVNNAGVAVNGLISELTDADMKWIMGINYWGVVNGTQAFLPSLAASSGQIANVSSVFGLIAVAKQAAYNATKFAVRGFTEALRQEMAMTGTPVAVSCIHPGGIKTAIAKRARVTASENSADTAATFDKVAFTSPERAARVIRKGLERERPRILVGPDAWAIAGLPRLLGVHYQAAVLRGAQRSGL
jgi:NADP-dependent 3-hydroxy acid dehydrogenase YdfG